MLAVPGARPLISPMTETSAADETGEDKATPESGSEANPEEKKPEAKRLPKEVGGPPGPEPTRYGDWQYKGRVTDF
jgi:hypothetical protein